MNKEQETAYKQLKDRLATINDLHSAKSLLFWDHQTYMPRGGVPSRAEQVATLSRLAHEMVTDDETERLLKASGESDPCSEDGALIRRARRDYERATRLPAELVAETSRVTSLAESAWVRARGESDWSLFAPHLEKVLALKGAFGEAGQEEFGREVISAFGYDWERGRQDRSIHPFCINFGPGDVRITTRFDGNWLAPALFGTMHEAGHALYEQGVDPSYTRTPLGGGTSMGVHESQSRLWENLVGRSRAFWSHYYLKLQEVFPQILGGIEAGAFYRAINALKPSEIRVEADEVTYNLHILLRFELEVALIEGSLSVADLPAAWNAKMEEYLGLVPKNDSAGVLQDIHWADGLFGYFPTYTIGNVLSVQFFDAAVEARPEIPEEIKSGSFSTLLGWLRENVHCHGSRYYPHELVERATGRPLDTAPYLRYLEDKFGELYSL